MKKSLIFLTITLSLLLVGLNVVGQNSFTQQGKASFYSNRMHGHKTFTGERYNKRAYTAAHATLPMNTWVKVTNIKNNKFIYVRINDRCSKHSNRIIDLSMAAARELDIISDGMGQVKIEVVQPQEDFLIPDSIKLVLPDTMPQKHLLTLPKLKKIKILKKGIKKKKKK